MIGTGTKLKGVLVDDPESVDAPLKVTAASSVVPSIWVECCEQSRTPRIVLVKQRIIILSLLFVTRAVHRNLY
jgi:hypothetical protein